MSMIPMELCRIVIRETCQEQHIFLREKSGRRRQFPIVIGLNEALEIHRKVNHQRTQRPMTHDLLAGVIEKLEAKVREVAVTRLEDNTFFAELVLDRDGTEVRVDARPSDAIALAVRFNVDILVDEAVVNQVVPEEDSA